jgi:putative ABC transport system substrate-binding protein
MTTGRRGSRLSRRQFMVGAGSAALLAGCGRLPWQAEPAAKVHRVGFLSVGAPRHPNHEAFQQGLRDHGYIMGENLIVEWRGAELMEGRLPALAAELVELPVEVIVTSGTQASLAAAQATTTIPVVTVTGDPVGDGLAASLARPGGNVTGLTRLGPVLGAKRLELLREAVPGAARIAVLWNDSHSVKAVEFQEIQAAAPVLGVELISLGVRRPDDLTGAFEAAQREGAQALLVLGDTLTTSRGPEIARLAGESRLPSLHELREYAVAGGLMSYGPSLTANYRRVAYYVDRILKGAKPADLPIEQPMRFEFVVNMRTARALGITFPHEVALQITEVIE